MPVLTPEYAANAIGIDLAVAGSAFPALVEAVNAVVERDTRRTFDLSIYTEHHDVPQATGELWVKHPPIISLTSLTDDANTTVITGRGNRSISVTEDVELYPDGGPYTWLRLVHNESAFTVGNKTVKVVFEGGYQQESMPADVQQAAVWIAAAWWEGPERMSRQSQNVDGQQIVWRPGAIPEEAKELLNAYRVVVI